jgi:uncharacterized DUF497 family protein
VTLVRFEWDKRKNQANQRKHGVNFVQAAQVFRDPLHVSQQDRIEGGEYRWLTRGLSDGFMLLVVAHTTTEETAEGERVEVIRIISARRANRKERQSYEDETG